MSEVRLNHRLVALLKKLWCLGFHIGLNKYPQQEPKQVLMTSGPVAVIDDGAGRWGGGGGGISDSFRVAVAGCFNTRCFERPIGSEGRHPNPETLLGACPKAVAPKAPQPLSQEFKCSTHPLRPRPSSTHVRFGAESLRLGV